MMHLIFKNKTLSPSRLGFYWLLSIRGRVLHWKFQRDILTRVKRHICNLTTVQGRPFTPEKARILFEWKRHSTREQLGFARVLLSHDGRYYDFYFVLQGKTFTLQLLDELCERDVLKILSNQMERQFGLLDSCREPG